MQNNRAKTTDKYHRILEAAIKIFAEQGFYQSTVAQIAKEAGVADGTIYLYFKNKDDILVNFFSFKAKQIFDGFRQSVDTASCAVDKLTSLVRRHLEEFQNDRNMAIVYQVEIHQSSRLIEAQIKKVSNLYLNLVTEIVEQGQKEGSLRTDLYVGLVKRYILGAIDEVINTWLHSETSYDLTTMADPLVELFIRGIGTKEYNRN